MSERPEEPGTMGPTGWRLPLVLVLVSGTVGYLITEQVYGRLPLLPWTAVPTLLLLAVAELIAAFHTRRRVRRRGGTVPIEPISVARLVALAKASAVLASLMAGLFAGMVLSLADRLHAPATRSDALTAGGTLFAAVVLFVAALLLEHACRVPGGRDSSDRDGTTK